MTVGELMKKLSQYPEGVEVVVFASSRDWVPAVVNLESRVRLQSSGKPR